MTEHRTITASRVFAAPADTIFDLIADPAQQPRWDGNDNLEVAASGQRVMRVGDTFTMTLTGGRGDRENHVVEFEEGRRIAWKPSPVGAAQPGHLWRWELEPIADGTTRVTHTYDWTGLIDEARIAKARATTAEGLDASIARLQELTEEESVSRGG